ncbi:aa3-type cytochrome c oxidase subunit IV [Pseudomonas sp. GX19020]|nr:MULTISPECIES: aa3-type cytochrome c oxidase subunit IV [Pseudomonadota]MCL4068546.1 aa3-type cytochrome c oxidase subunit IV [Pseudomonas sp. GX19020]SEB45394.1 aa3 type cytochrome c oxidase subunit IV [Rhodobacter sp. 24-YEA-8]
MADHQHGDHTHGSMDIRTQEKTFAGFIRVATWTVVVCVVVLVFLGLART